MEENIGFVFLNFEPSEENQLAVKLNERVKIIEDEDSHWWFVQSLYSGRFGYIPADIIQTKEEREAFLNQQKNKQVKNNLFKVDNGHFKRF